MAECSRFAAGAIPEVPPQIPPRAALDVPRPDARGREATLWGPYPAPGCACQGRPAGHMVMLLQLGERRRDRPGCRCRSLIWDYETKRVKALPTRRLAAERVGPGPNGSGIVTLPARSLVRVRRCQLDHMQAISLMGRQAAEQTFFTGRRNKGATAHFV